MSTHEINPDNPLVEAMRDQYAKLLAIVMDKHRLDEIRISSADIEHFSLRFGGEMSCVVLKVEHEGDPHKETMVLKLARDADAIQLAELDRIQRNDRNKVSLHGSPVDPNVKGAPQPIDPKTGQHLDYFILSDDERAKGFVRPVRLVYLHKTCRTTTRMNQKIAETYARDPKFYGWTFCVTCGKHFPVDQFVWDGTDQAVGS